MPSCIIECHWHEGGKEKKQEDKRWGFVSNFKRKKK